MDSDADSPSPPPASRPLFLVDDESALGGKERTLLRRLRTKYTGELVRDVLFPLIDQTSAVSLRALDWCVVNWSKQHNVVCSSAVPGEMTNIHHAYHSALGYWKRRLFDPFRRRTRIIVRLDGEERETTLGQANFALFTYETGILAYVIGNVDAIEKGHEPVAAAGRPERFDAERRGVRRKRQELTKARKSMCFAYDAPVRIVFD